MRKHLIAVTALVGATATAGPALAQAADTFAPGTSDAAQSGRTAQRDLRGDAARAPRSRRAKPCPATCAATPPSRPGSR